MADKLVILRTGALGDVLLLRPCLWGLKEAFPDIEITVLAPGERGRLLLDGGLADSVFDLDLADACWLFRPDGEPPAGLERALAGMTRALVFLPKDNGMSSAFKGLGARQVAFYPANPQQGGPLHACEHLWNGCAEALGQPGLYLPDTANLPPLRGNVEQAKAFLSQNGISENAYFCVHPGSGSKSKNLPVTSFAAIAGSVLTSGQLGKNREQFRIAVIAGEADGSLGEELAALIPDAVLFSQTSLVVLAGILSQSCGYLGNDSGVSHMAGQSGVLTTAVFLSTDPRLWSPVGPNVHCLMQS